MNIQEILNKYTKGEVTLEDTNAALQAAGAGFHLNPDKNRLTEEDRSVTVVGYTPDKANGYGLLDTGTGSLDKVHVTDGVLDHAVNTVLEDGSVSMLADVLICGKVYAVRGAQLVEKE